MMGIASKSATETANLMWEGNYQVLTYTVLWRCEGGRTSNDCSWLIPARQWRLDINNNCITLDVLTIINCMYTVYNCVLLFVFNNNIVGVCVMKMRHSDGSSCCNLVKPLDCSKIRHRWTANPQKPYN